MPLGLVLAGIPIFQPEFLLQIVQPEMILGLAIVLFLLLGLMLMRLSFGRDRHRSSRSRSSRASAEAVRLSRVSEERRTSRSETVPVSDRQTTESTERLPREPLPTETQIRRREQTDPFAAAALWERLGRWTEAAACYRYTGQLERSARIYQALQDYRIALPVLKQALDREPHNERVHLHLIHVLIDTGRREEALELLDAMLADKQMGRSAPGVFVEIAQLLESLADYERAMLFYQQALDRDRQLPGISARLQYLDQVMRLRDASDESDGGEDSSPRQLLRAIADDSSSSPATKRIGVSSSEEEWSRILASRDTMVGHLALGLLKDEPRFPSGSLYAPARRFKIEELIRETPRSAIFRGSDQLLDFPVALRLYRIPHQFEGLDVLNERLQSIARLNHPNIAKITYADRDGRLIRIVTEFLPGGPLEEFFQRLGGVGLPLIVRMAIHLSSALHAAHMRGVPHGDISSGNMIIGPDQRIKLVDFALSAVPVIPTKHDPRETAEPPVAFTKQENSTFKEAVRSDLHQFADTLEMMLGYARNLSEAIAGGSGPAINDTSGELHQLANDLRSGAMPSMMQAWQVLQDIYERTLPSASSPPAGSPRPSM